MLAKTAQAKKSRAPGEEGLKPIQWYEKTVTYGATTPIARHRSVPIPSPFRLKADLLTSSIFAGKCGWDGGGFGHPIVDRSAQSCNFAALLACARRHRAEAA